MGALQQCALHRRASCLLGCAVFLIVLSGLAGCAGAPHNTGVSEMTGDPDTRAFAGASRADAVNQELLSLAVGDVGPIPDYRIGPDDSLKVSVFGVPELSDEYRVSASGRIIAPLIGSVTVSGLTVNEAEQLIADEYGRSYLRNPQVRVEVTEFRSRRYTILGSVGSPQIYASNRPVSLVEALTLAGGIADGAGDFVYVTDRVHDPETGEMLTRSVVLVVDDLLLDPVNKNFILGETAVVNVPRGGFVFVEGDVGSPGVYQQSRTTSVLTVLAQAGGLKWEAQKNNLRLVRRDPETREWSVIEKSYYDIRDNPENDIPLLHGDVLVVSTQPLKGAWLATARAIGAMIFVGAYPF